MNEETKKALEKLAKAEDKIREIKRTYSISLFSLIFSILVLIFAIAVLIFVLVKKILLQ